MSKRKVDLFAALLCKLVSTFIIFEAKDFPPGSTPVGPGMFPFAIALIVLLLSGLLVFQTFRLSDKEASTKVITDKVKTPLGVIALLLVYTLFIEHLGFVVSSVLFLLGFFQIFTKSSLIVKIISSVSIPVGVWAVFNLLLGVPLPTGYFI